MKQISIVFIIFMMVIFLPIGINQSTMIKSDNLKNDYNEAIDNASDDAAKALLISNDSSSYEIISEGNKEDFKEIQLNLKEGLSRFYRSLYLNLGIQNSFSEQQALLNKIPIIVAAGYDGYYIHTWQEDEENGNVKITNDWTSKKRYSIIDSKYNIKISFTLGDYVYIQDIATGQTCEGNRQTFATKYPSEFGDSFDQSRTQVINQMIQRDLQYYTYNNNNIAKRNGWKLIFDVPYWGNRAVTTISFVAFLQGKVLSGAPDKYNTYGLGAAKIVENKKLYGYLKSGQKLYSTNQDGTNLISFNNEEDAAKNGYSPDSTYYLNNGGTTPIITNTNVAFSIISSNGIPIIRLNSGMDINSSYVVSYNGKLVTVTKDNILADGTLMAIPKSIASNTQVSLGNINPFIFSKATSIDQGMDAGDTPPEIAIQSVTQQDDTCYKVSIVTRDLDIGDNVSIIYKVVDGTGSYLTGYPNDMNVQDSTKTNSLSFNSNGKFNTFIGYVNCPVKGAFQIQIWAVDNSGIKSQLGHFNVTN